MKTAALFLVFLPAIALQAGIPSERKNSPGLRSATPVVPSIDGTFSKRNAPVVAEISGVAPDGIYRHLPPVMVELKDLPPQATVWVEVRANDDRNGGCDPALVSAGGDIHDNTDHTASQVFCFEAPDSLWPAGTPGKRFDDWTHFPRNLPPFPHAGCLPGSDWRSVVKIGWRRARNCSSPTDPSYGMSLAMPDSIPSWRMRCSNSISAQITP